MLGKLLSLPLFTLPLIGLSCASTVKHQKTESSSVKQRVVFSAVSGQVMLAGKPVSGLKVRQRWLWFDVDDAETETTTNSEGRFSFPEVTRRKLKVSDELMIMQEIKVEHDGKEIVVWNHTKQNTERNSELGGHAIVLTAHIDKESTSQHVPVSPDKISMIDGVAEIDHPYVKRLAAARPKVKAARVANALKKFLSTQPAIQHMNGFFPKVAGTSATVREVVEVDQVKLEDWYLFDKPMKGRFAHTGDAAFIGFTARAKVKLALSSGEQLTLGFFCWTMYLPIDAQNEPGYAISTDRRWEISTKDYAKGKVKNAITSKRLQPFILQQMRGQQKFFEAFGPGQHTLKAITAELVEVTFVKDDYAGLKIRGSAQLKIDESDETHDYWGHCYVNLGSLANANYEPGNADDAPTFNVVQFRIHLATNKRRYKLAEKIRLSFTIENLLSRPNRYLNWHTPFEGFRNDFLDVRNAETGAEVPYHGVMASRAPPSKEDYLAIKPRGKISTEVEINEAYPIKEKGRYTIAFKPLSISVNQKPVEITVE